MNNINNLTLEQEFKLAIYKQKIYKLSDKNIKKHLIVILQQMMIKDNMIKYFIKNSTL
uniref:phycobilisome degradation protein n=1 Tax=Hypnea brasiliensis TaxID=1866962 RepID=UPI0023F2DD09|nr:phycobilisome degradation protein [Hypnea brasiliensis]WCH55292.1 phycobilisome degradation protein [Hypnea brasiliensis]WDY84734.1 phycobilisome degradation protein [Hypnea brasiliensis]